MILACLFILVILILVLLPICKDVYYHLKFIRDQAYCEKQLAQDPAYFDKKLIQELENCIVRKKKLVEKLENNPENQKSIKVLEKGIRSCEERIKKLKFS